MRELVGIVVLSILGLIALALLCAFISWPLGSYECRVRWERSGFKTDYGPIQGCLISKDGITYLPEGNYRELGEE